MGRSLLLSGVPQWVASGQRLKSREGRALRSGGRSSAEALTREPWDTCVETVSVKHSSVCREAPGWSQEKHSRYLEFSENSIATCPRVAREERGLELAACRPQGPFSRSEVVNLSSGQVLPFSEGLQDSPWSTPCAIFTFRTGVVRTNSLGFKQDTEIFSPKDVVGQRGWSVSF